MAWHGTARAPHPTMRHPTPRHATPRHAMLPLTEGNTIRPRTERYTCSEPCRTTPHHATPHHAAPRRTAPLRSEAAATAAERRAASRSPSPHHRQTTMESSNADASAAPCAPKPSTTRPPSRLQLNTGPEQPHPPPTPKAPSQHHRTPAAATAPARDCTPVSSRLAEGWGSFGLEHLSEAERKRKREHAQETDGGAKRRKS